MEISKEQINDAINCIDVVLAYDGPDDTGEDDMNWNIFNEAMNRLRSFADEYAAVHGKNVYKMSLPQIRDMLIKVAAGGTE